MSELISFGFKDPPPPQWKVDAIVSPAPLSVYLSDGSERRVALRLLLDPYQFAHALPLGVLSIPGECRAAEAGSWWAPRLSGLLTDAYQPSIALPLRIIAVIEPAPLRFVLRRDLEEREITVALRDVLDLNRLARILAAVDCDVSPEGYRPPERLGAQLVMCSSLLVPDYIAPEPQPRGLAGILAGRG